MKLEIDEDIEKPVAFVCKDPNAEDTTGRQWIGTISILDYYDEMIEADISTDNRCMHSIIGKYMFGHFICIPEWGMCCSLAGSLDDWLCNLDRLKGHIGNIEAITLARALSLIGRLNLL
ncbi:MAG: hypothetical protein LUC60_10080 [Lachnospiraceae bacterium]|nr:hypothetical protein [Lachnospiraceae bacterium]